MEKLQVYREKTFYTYDINDKIDEVQKMQLFKYIKGILIERIG